MKKTPLRLFLPLLSGLLMASLLFASCNANKSMFGTDDSSSPPIESSSTPYSSVIQDLENQIIELQQNQYISNSERQKELARLEALLAELKQNGGSVTLPAETKPKGDGTDTSKIPVDTQANTPSASTPTFSYQLEGDNAILTGYSGTDKFLTVPTSIDGHTVVAIADSAFSSTTLTSITLPTTVTKIGWFAFQACTALTSVTIPDSVTSIGYSAFPSSSTLTIYCHSNSFAQQYAQSYGISYTVI